MSTLRSERQRQILEAYHHTEESRNSWTAVYLTLAIISILFYFLFRERVIGESWEHRVWTLRLTFAAFLGFAVLGLSRWIEFRIKKNAQAPASRYNLIRLLRLIAGAFTILVLSTALFQNWYTAAMSLGLLSVILGFALQIPISSFVGWIYIVYRNPYKVGDRILIEQFRGEVFDIGYLDTGIREFSGHQLSADVPTGRLVRFPNNLILRSSIVNYRWNQFPFTWDETGLYVPIDSDLKQLELLLRQITIEVLGPEMALEIEELKSRPNVRTEEFENYPFVNFSFDQKNKINVRLLYLVEPRKAAHVRNLLLIEILKKFRETDLLESLQIEEK